MPLIQDIIGFAQDPLGKRSSQAGGSTSDPSAQNKKRAGADLEPGQIPGQEYQPVDFPYLQKRNGRRNGNKRD